MIKSFFDILTNRFRSRNLRFDILSSFFVLQVITAISIVTYTYVNNSRSIVDFSNRLMENASISEVANIADNFREVLTSTELGGYLVRDTTKAAVINKDLIQFMMGHCRQYKLVDSVYVATESGYFVQVKPIIPGTAYRVEQAKILPKKAEFALRIVDRSDVKPTEVWIYLDNDGKKLDEEKIPVKRSKIAGLAWLRPTDDSSPIAGSVLVTLAGGRLLAKAVHVENDTVQIDLTAIDPIHLTLSDIRSLDFTAGRVVSLVSLKPEKVEVEPFFGSLFLIEGFSEYFRPRSVGSAASIDGTATIESLFIQPRTTMTWRIPPDSLLLRTRARLSKDVGQGSALMRILLDDKELMRQVFASGVGATSDQHTNSQNGSVTDLDIRLSVQGARKLQIVVDYGPNGDAGGTIRLEKPRIEK